MENDKALSTATWLTYKMADRDYVKTLACSICTRFNTQLKGIRNYKPVLIDGLEREEEREDVVLEKEKKRKCKGMKNEKWSNRGQTEK